MRLSRALALLLVVVLLSPSAAFAGATAPQDTQLTITGQPKVGIYWDEIGPESTPDLVRHRGRLTTAGGAPVANAPIELHRKLVGGQWGVQEGETDAEGRYEFITPIVGNARYKVVYDGDAVYEPAESGLTRLKAMRDFNAELVEKPKVAVFKGNINPEWENKVVKWQRKTCKTCAWRTVDQERSGDNGTWSFKGNYPPLNKKWFYRATLEGTDLFVESYSAMLITTTTPARQPAARTAVR